MEILTTFIKQVVFDYDVLAAQFEVDCVSYQGWNKDQRNNRLPHLSNRIYQAGPVLSLVQYHKQSECWLLRPKGSTLKLADDSVAVRNESLHKVPNWLLANLLVRAIPRVVSPIVKKQSRIEADGLYYVVNSHDTVRGHQLTAVNVEPFFGTFNGKGVLKVGVATFSNIQAHRLSNGELPYQIAKLRRFSLDACLQKLVKCQQGEYVKKPLYSSIRNRVKAIKLSKTNTLEAYYKTKLGVISMFLEDVSDVYHGAFDITLESIETNEHSKLDKTPMLQSYEKIYHWFADHPVYIVNKSQSPEAGQHLIEQLLAKRIPVMLAQTVQPDQLTILIVDPKETYKDVPEQDPYLQLRAQYPNAVIQSCYPENLLEENVKSVSEVLLKELLVKFEVHHRQLQIDYPVLPYNAWFIHPVRPNVKDPNKESWPMAYCRVDSIGMEFGWLSEAMEESLKISLNPAEYSQVFSGFNRADVIFWPEKNEFLLITDTAAVTLPNESKIHNLIKDLDQASASGVPKSLINHYLSSNKKKINGTELQRTLITLCDNYLLSIPVKEFEQISYKGKDKQAFFDFLTDQGYRLKTRWRSSSDGPMFITAGIWRDRQLGLYSIGTAGPAKQDLDTFYHIYQVTSTLSEPIPEWFWRSLMVWHIKHKSATVYPWVFKHLREYANKSFS